MKSEEELILQSKQRDQDAFRELFDQYHKKVYRIAYGVVRQREDALDIVQEVFIKLYQSIQAFEGKSKFYTYLYRMTMNTAIDHARKIARSRSSSVDDTEVSEFAEGPEKRPDAVFLYKELETRLKAALEKLPPDQRMALVFREIQGLSYQEMAETMGCSIGTVMSRLHYGRKKIRELMKDDFGPEEE